MRNGQPLAAMQYQGRLLNTWSEIIYDGRGYCLCYAKDKDRPNDRVLIDESSDECLFVKDDAPLQITLHRALPLPLLVMVAMRVLDEGEAVSGTVGAAMTETETPS
jgi:hypothetical protein